MYVYIKGVLAEKEPTRVVVEAGGLGYGIVIPLSTYDQLPNTGEEVKLLVHHAVREDDEILFGFSTEAEREFFLKLVSVSGVGPRIAIAILSGATIADLSLAISSGNAKRISAIKGVGKKTAEKICVELADKVSVIGSAVAAGIGDRAATGDAIKALTALGFTDETASSRVGEVLARHPDIRDVETIVRLSLQAK